MFAAGAPTTKFRSGDRKRIAELVAVGTVVRSQNLRLGPESAAVFECVGFARCIDARGRIVRAWRADNQSVAVALDRAAELVRVARCAVAGDECRAFAPGRAGTREYVHGALIGIVVGCADESRITRQRHGAADPVEISRIGAQQFLLLDPSVARAYEDVGPTDGTEHGVEHLRRTDEQGVAGQRQRPAEEIRPVRRWRNGRRRRELLSLGPNASHVLHHVDLAGPIKGRRCGDERGIAPDQHAEAEQITGLAVI